MATVAQTMRKCLLNYPNIFPCPMAVAVHWFTVIGNGMEWVNGELVNTFVDPNAGDAMKYDDLDDIRGPSDRFSLEDSAYRVSRKFVADNIDAICNAPVSLRLNDYRPTSYYFLKGICVEHARVLNVPHDINKDWAQAVYDFIIEWEYFLRCEYGVGSLTTFPKDIQVVFRQIENVKRTIYPVLYGKDYDIVLADRKTLMDQLMKEI